MTEMDNNAKLCFLSKYGGIIARLSIIPVAILASMLMWENGISFGAELIGGSAAMLVQPLFMIGFLIIGVTAPNRVILAVFSVLIVIGHHYLLNLESSSVEGIVRPLLSQGNLIRLLSFFYVSEFIHFMKLRSRKILLHSKLQRDQK